MNQAGLGWLAYALMTVACWGLYGILLHGGQVGMADPTNGRYKAYLFVGIAYFLVAVLAPLAILVATGADWNLPAKGITWSLVAGIAGAVGAFGVLLAFGAKGTPAVVMSIVFAGAPIVNAIVSMALHPPAGGGRRRPLAVLRRDRVCCAGRLSRHALQAGPRPPESLGLSRGYDISPLVGGPLAFRTVAGPAPGVER